MRKINSKTVISIMLIVFFGTFIVLSLVKKSIFEGLATAATTISADKSFTDVSKGGGAIDSSVNALINATKGYNSGPSDEGHQELNAQVNTASTTRIQQQQQQQAIAEQQRKQQRDANLPIAAPVPVQVTPAVSLISQPSHSMPMLSPQVPSSVQSQTTVPVPPKITASSETVEVYSF